MQKRNHKGKGAGSKMFSKDMYLYYCRIILIKYSNSFFHSYRSYNKKNAFKNRKGEKKITQTIIKKSHGHLFQGEFFLYFIYEDICLQ